MAGAQVISAALTESVTLRQRGALDCLAGVPGWFGTFGCGAFAREACDRLLLRRPGPDARAPDRPRRPQGHDARAWARPSARGGPSVSATHPIDLFITQNGADLAEAVATRGLQFPPAGADLPGLMACQQAEERGINPGKAERSGVADAAAICDRYAAHVAKWRALSAGIGDDLEEFAEVLWTGVNSRVDPDRLRARAGSGAGAGGAWIGSTAGLSTSGGRFLPWRPPRGRR